MFTFKAAMDVQEKFGFQTDVYFQGWEELTKLKIIGGGGVTIACSVHHSCYIHSVSKKPVARHFATNNLERDQ